MKNFANCITLFSVVNAAYPPAENRFALRRRNKKMEYSVGDIIEFGSYTFDADGTERPIKWQIMEIEDDGTAVLLSCYAADIRAYHSEKTNITWAESSIRAWLNCEFYNNAFSDEEKKHIIPYRLANNDSIGEFTQEYADNWKRWGLDGTPYLGTKWHTKGGEDTTDKVWLLSLDDLKKYGSIFKTDKDRQLKPSPYIYSRYVYGNNEYAKRNGTEGNVWWWLRSPGIYQHSAATVGPGGFITANGSNADNPSGGIRPAFKINLKNL